MSRPKLYRTPRHRLATARHEAAHAVVADHLGMRVCSVAVFDEVNKDRELGECLFDLRFWCGPMRNAIIAMAGPAADHVLSRTPRDDYSLVDATFIKSLGLQGRELFVLRDLVHPFIRKHRAKIERVARALVKKGRLSGDEVRKLIRRGRK